MAVDKINITTLAGWVAFADLNALYRVKQAVATKMTALGLSAGTAYSAPPVDDPNAYTMAERRVIDWVESIGAGDTADKVYLQNIHATLIARFP